MNTSDKLASLRNPLTSGQDSESIWTLTEHPGNDYSPNTRKRDRDPELRRNRPNHKEQMVAQKHKEWLDRPFISIDGEGLKVPDGTPQPYSLLCNSEGEYIQREEGLHTVEILEFLLETKRENPKAFLVGFGFGYDSNQIVKDLPWNSLAVLHHVGKVNWNDYKIGFAPGKWFSVTKDGITARVDDTFAHFNTGLLAAIEAYGVGTESEKQIIQTGKGQRGEFVWENIKEVRDYCFMELKLHVEIMNILRKLMDDAGYRIHNWYGPAPLAKYVLREHKSSEHLVDFGKSHPDIWINARYAYTGGRFEIFRCGYRNGPVFSYDINNAYVWALMKLPSLKDGKWERTFDVDYIRDILRKDPYAFIQVEIRYYKAKQEWEPQPLFRRFPDGAVMWTERVQNWYWGPEAALVIDDPAATILGAWVYKDTGERPFYWVKHEYARRMALKAAGNPAEFVIKRALVSIYGCFAQRKGWKRISRNDKQSPYYHQLEFAGFITSCCKAKLFRAAQKAFETGDLVSVDTDAVFTTRSLDESELEDGIGLELGQWKPESFTGGLFWQNGVYWLRTEKGWTQQKSRGAPKGKIDIALAWTALRNQKAIVYDRKSFVTLGQALQERFSQWRSWNTKPFAIEMGGSRESKRWHIHRMCPNSRFKNWRNGGLHWLGPPLIEDWIQGEKGFYPSQMHSLPWAETEPEYPELEPFRIMEMPEWPDEIE